MKTKKSEFLSGQVITVRIEFAYSWAEMCHVRRQSSLNKDSKVCCFEEAECFLFY